MNASWKAGRPLVSMALLAGAMASCGGPTGTTTPTGVVPPPPIGSRELIFGVCTKEESGPPPQMGAIAAAVRFVLLQQGDRPYRIKFGKCPPSMPPCFAQEGGIMCRAEVLGRTLRAAAALALRYARDPETTGKMPDRLARDADVAALSTEPGARQDIDALLQMDEPGAPAPDAEASRRLHLYRSIGRIPISFLVGHELSHADGNNCTLPLGERDARRFEQMAKLDMTDQLFCSTGLEPMEVRADRCGLAHLAALATASNEPREGVSGDEASFTRRGGAALVAWYLLSNWLVGQPAGAIKIGRARGYLRPSLRALLAASEVAPPEDGGRACNESAKLIVTSIQNDYESCKGKGDVPDALLAMLPKAVEKAWGDNVWSQDTFVCAR